MASHPPTRPTDNDRSQATAIAMTEKAEEDISDWPELRSRQSNEDESRRYPIQWGQGLQNEDEEYLDNLQSRLKRLQTQSQANSGQFSEPTAASMLIRTGKRKNADDDTISIGSSIPSSNEGNGELNDRRNDVRNPKRDDDNDSNDDNDHEHHDPTQPDSRDNTDIDEHDNDKLLFNDQDDHLSLSRSSSASSTSDLSDRTRLKDIPTTSDDPDPMDNPGLPLLWNVEGRSDVADQNDDDHRVAGDERRDEANTAEDPRGTDEQKMGKESIVVSPIDESSPGLSESPQRLLPSTPPSHPPRLSPNARPGPTKPSSSTDPSQPQLYPKPRLLSTDSKVRFSPRVRVKSGLSASGLNSRVPSGTGGPRVVSGLKPDEKDQDDQAGASKPATRSRSMWGSRTPSAPTSPGVSSGIQPFEPHSVASSASISLCASPPPLHSWLFSSNNLTAALGGMGDDGRTGSGDYFSFPGASSSSAPMGTKKRSLTPVDREIEKLSAQAARKRAESWARDHGRSLGQEVDGMMTPRFVSSSSTVSRDGLGMARSSSYGTRSGEIEPGSASGGGILIRTYSGRYIPSSPGHSHSYSYSSQPGEYGIKTESQIIWGTTLDKLRNPRWWSWKWICFWRAVKRFWCEADDDEWDEDQREGQQTRGRQARYYGETTSLLGSS